jgi:hypothetical protein
MVGFVDLFQPLLGQELQGGIIAKAVRVPDAHQFPVDVPHFLQRGVGLKTQVVEMLTQIVHGTMLGGHSAPLTSHI